VPGEHAADFGWIFAYTVDNNRLPTKFFAGQTPNDTRRKWETIASISTWEVATLVNENDPSQGLRWNHGGSGKGRFSSRREREALAIYWADGLAGADDGDLRFRVNAPNRM
jgi:hypothetical protein